MASRSAPCALQLALCICLLAAQQAAAGTGVPQTNPWPQYAANSANTNSLTTSLGSTLQQLWRTYLPGKVTGSCVVDNAETLYVAADGHGLYSLSLDGQVKWKLHSAVAAGGTTPLVTDTGSILLLQKASVVEVDGTGSITRSVPIGSDVMPGAAPVRAASLDGSILFGLSNGSLARWDDGTLTSVDIGLPIVGSPAVVGDFIFLVASNSTHGLVQCRKDGKVVWAVPTPRQYASPVVDAAHVYVQQSDGKVHAYSVTDGEKKWSFLLEGTATATPALVPAGAASLLIIPSSNGIAYAVSAATGVQQWKVNTQGPITASPISLTSDGNAAAAAASVVVIVSSDGMAYIADSVDGEVLHTAQAGPSLVSSPCADDYGSFYTVSSSGVLFAFGDACSSAVPCLGHGTCDNSDHSCACQRGWDGSDCSFCAPAFFGADCTPCMGLNGTAACNGHGACDGGGTHSGDGHCTCDDGWMGSTCLACQAGYWGSSCSACPGLATAVCSGHGTCDGSGTRGGTGVCSCDVGWFGDDCSGCAQGFWGHDCEPCPGVSAEGKGKACNGHGKCAEGGKHAAAAAGKLSVKAGTCECGAAWTGAACSSCAVGYGGSACAACPGTPFCHGHGDCKGKGDAAVCHCTADYSGDSCQVAPPIGVAAWVFGTLAGLVALLCLACTVCRGKGDEEEDAEAAEEAAHHAHLTALLEEASVLPAGSMDEDVADLRSLLGDGWDEEEFDD